VWAQEIRVDRRFTWNQPPGWSPILAVSSRFVSEDLQGANALFLWVLVLLGLSSVRLASLVARGAPGPAWLLPGALVAAHGLLMFEPGSTNFPDSLFAACVLAVAGAIAGGRWGWFVALGVAAQALRWPGTVVATILALLAVALPGDRALRPLGRLWAIIAVAVVVAALGARAGEVVDRDIGDLGFILWFETFPEHWHGDYDLAALLARVPEFYGLWARYTGGGLLWAMLFLAVGKGGTRPAGRWLLGSALAYSLLLCTIDHHPTHYFLPLVALTGPAAVAASAAPSHRGARYAVSLLTLAGLWIFLSRGQV